MSPIVRVAHFMGMSFFAIIVLFCAAWWCMLALCAHYHGPLGVVVFIMGTTILPTVICEMIQRQHRRHHRR